MKVFGYRAAAIFVMWLIVAAFFTLVVSSAGVPTWWDSVLLGALVAAAVGLLLGVLVGIYKAVNWLWEAADDARYARQR